LVKKVAASSNDLHLIFKLTGCSMITRIAQTDDHKLLQESTLIVWQPCKAPTTSYI